VNFFAAFQSEVFRPLVTLLIPGALAISTWCIALCWQFPKLHEAMAAHSSESYLILFFVIVATGISVEDLGAKIEIRFDESANKASDGDFDKEWYTYLRTAFVADPIGRGYARTLVLRLKFQLGIMLASCISGLGIVWLLWLGMDCRVAITLLLMSAALSAWNYKAARDVHGALERVRKELCGEIRIIAPEKSGNTPVPTH
jgi:hypothetical protein